MSRISPRTLCRTCGIHPVGHQHRTECYTCRPKRKLCAGCGQNPPAYQGRTHCYACKPKAKGWPETACRACGSAKDYYAGGLCKRCHRGYDWVDACLDCLAWGVTRRHGGLCQACRGWRERNAVGECVSCHRSIAVNTRGACRLCSRQSNYVRPKHQAIDIAFANRHGQQLFLADTFRQKRPDPPPALKRKTAWPQRYPVSYRQQTAFDQARDLAAVYPGDRLEQPVPVLAAALDDALIEHAQAHGWSHALEDYVRRGIRILLATQDTPGAPIKASDAEALVRTPVQSVASVIDLLRAVGMLEDDRPAPLEDWFARIAAGLPEQIYESALLWIRVLRDGSNTAPRLKPRHVEHVRRLARCALTVLHDWSAQGYTSLREIDAAAVHAAMPTGNPHLRASTALALKSMFTVLKARRIVFTNPAAKLPTAAPGATIPLPVDTAPIREALTGPDPARAAITALIAFHALRNRQIRELQLTDIRDARLHLDDREIPLAQPVRTLLRAWLDERERRWPATANTHLFITEKTAVRTTAVSSHWVSQCRAVPTQAIRADRILEEARITGGDERRLVDLFGLTVAGAQRYTRTIDPPATDSQTHRA